MNLNVSEVIKNFEYFLFKIVIVFALREHTFYIYKHHDKKLQNIYLQNTIFF